MRRQSKIEFPEQQVNEDHLERIKQLIATDRRVEQTLALKLARGQMIDIKPYVIEKAMRVFENSNVYERLETCYSEGYFLQFKDHIHLVFFFTFGGLSIAYDDNETNIVFTCVSDSGVEIKSVVWEWGEQDSNDLIDFVRGHFLRFMKEHFFAIHRII